jgi:hypothetical protein
MIKSVFTLGIVALLASSSQAQSLNKPVNDRIEDLCAVSDIDLAGKRLARECRAQVRAQGRGISQLTAAASLSKKLMVKDTELAQLPK